MDHTKRYGTFALCREMAETPDVIRRFDENRVASLNLMSERVLLSGEGSSRIFPAKRMIAHALREGWSQYIATEGASQAREYDLSRTHLFVASNSGRTAEGVHLIRSTSCAATTGIVAHAGTPIATESDDAFILGCGPEEAVAATKSVVEQALVYDVLFRSANGAPHLQRNALADAFENALGLDISRSIIEPIVKASTVYFAGRNDGVAEELTLKANEIIRKRSDFLEGTYAVHGIEEVMRSGETVVLVDPFPEQEETFRTVLVDGVGLNVVAIAPRRTIFPTIVVDVPSTPDSRELVPYILLAAGWNLLIEVGIALGIDLDKPERARKVGNEFSG